MSNLEPAEKHILTGNHKLASGDMEGAIKYYELALKKKPDYEIAYCNIGNAYLLGRDLKTAVKYYKKAIKVKPNYVMANCHLGEAYSELGLFKKALTQLQKTIEIDPDYPHTYLYLGNILLAQGSLDDAVMCYKMTIKKDPKNAIAYNNLGAVYGRQFKFEGAAEILEESLKYSPADPVTLGNIATAYAKLKETKKSIEYFTKAYKYEPESSLIVSGLYHQLRNACDWKGANKILPVLNELTQKEIKHSAKPGQEPFVNAIYDGDIKRNYEIAKLWCKSMTNLITDLKPFKFTKSNKKRKINIGYLSGHFLDHQTGHLISGLFPKHDRSKFNIFGFTCAADDNSVYRRNIANSCDQFFDISSLDHSDVAKVIYQNKVDILVDLDGHTDNNRLIALALRPAPIIVTYLGFPGTTGADFIDYMITDHVVTPRSSIKYFSENFAYLPHSYQVNNDEQQISKKEFTRSDFKLPQKSFVFCCFNGSYKIESEIFDSWIRILKKVPKSVLWLLKTNELAEKNLLSYAKKKGVRKNNIIFSDPVDRDKHLKRISLSDLALDTLTCNGHTTTSDALWAGVPVVTVQGVHYAARVASSLLTSAGTTETITKDISSYEKLAVDLATNPHKLKKVKDKLNKNIPKNPPFNTSVFTKNLEKIYLEMFDIYNKGVKPKEIDIKKNG